MAVLVERPLEVTSNSDGLVDLIGIGIEPCSRDCWRNIANFTNHKIRLLARYELWAVLHARRWRLCRVIDDDRKRSAGC